MHRLSDRLARLLDRFDRLRNAAAVLILVAAGAAYLLLHSPEAPGRVSVTEGTMVVNLVLSASPDGHRVLATWGRYGYPYRIAARALDGAGRPVGPQQQLLGANGRLPRLAKEAAPDGTTLAAWDEREGGSAANFGVEGRWRRQLPASLGDFVRDVAYSPRRREWLIAGVDPDNRGSPEHVRLRRLTGGRLTPRRPAPNGQQTDGDCRVANEPRTGRWLLACIARGRVEAQVLDPELHAIGPRRVLAPADEDRDALAVAAGPGVFAVAWERGGYGARPAELSARTLDDGGRPRTPGAVADRLYGASETSDLAPELAYHPRTGQFLLAYAGVTDPAQRFKWTQRIYGRRLTPEGRWLDVRRVPLAADRDGDLEQRSPKVVPGPGRDWLVAWEGRNAARSKALGSYEVYAAPWRPAP